MFFSLAELNERNVKLVCHGRLSSDYRQLCVCYNITKLLHLSSLISSLHQRVKHICRTLASISRRFIWEITGAYTHAIAKQSHPIVPPWFAPLCRLSVSLQYDAVLWIFVRDDHSPTLCFTSSLTERRQPGTTRHSLTYLIIVIMMRYLQWSITYICILYLLYISSVTPTTANTIGQKKFTS